MRWKGTFLIVGEKLTLYSDEVGYRSAFTDMVNQVVGLMKGRFRRGAVVRMLVDGKNVRVERIV